MTRGKGREGRTVFAMIGLITMHRLESACQPEPGIVAEIVGTLAEINGP